MTADPVRAAEDGYEAYFAEKLWSWIPELYRDADMRAAPPDVLRALIEVVAGDAATARRAIDRLWEDVLIDYADDWAVPYIGDLVGARLLNSPSSRGVRVDVARTSYYRRRAGTLPVLEALIKDITGWGGVAVEAFRRLARHWHGLDSRDSVDGAGRFETPAGGFANLRSPGRCAGLDGPFDGFAHRPDFRRLAGYRGRYAVPKINIHLFRQKPVKIRESMGFALDAHWFTFDPSGRDTPLFANDSARDPGRWSPPRIWNLPAPIARSLLDDAVFEIGPAVDLSAMGPRLAAMRGARIEGVRTLAELARLDGGIGPPAYPSAADFRALQVASRSEDCGKYRLYPAMVEIETGMTFATKAALPPETVAAADLSWQAASPVFPPGVRALIDPERGRVRTNGEPFFFPRLFHYGQFEWVGAGGHDRRAGVQPGIPALAGTNSGLTPIAIPAAALVASHEFPESKTYEVQGQIPPIAALRLQAANSRRPYVSLSRAPGFANRAIISSQAPAPGLAPDDPGNLRSLDIDGLWLTVAQSAFPVQTLTDPDQRPTPVMTTLLIDASAAPIQRVTLRNVTLDPGGERARLKPCEAVAIPYVRLLLRGEVRELVIERSIVGPIEELTAAADPCSVGTVIIRDSVVQSLDPARPAIFLRSGRLEIERSTVLGAIAVNRLDASELLVTGLVTVTDNQHGCFRFSAAGADPAMRLPRQFESHLVRGGIAPHFFVSRRFGDPGYAQLSQTAPEAIVTGGENRSEIGAFNRSLAPVRAADLRTKLDEYAPMNTICQLIYET
ncbi:MAG TPA: hypothetical protein VD846_10385 [Allosphingosinicella sp.]|nr:hypothetical protein [Allosphingosinicella sp.]